jgi:hypothetical protein
MERTNRRQETCAACDCRLDGAVVQVRIGDHTVEVCCEECAEKLGEAGRSSGMPS